MDQRPFTGRLRGRGDPAASGGGSDLFRAADALAVNVAAWETHARVRIGTRGLGDRPSKHAFRWTRDSTTDPGASLLGDVQGRRVLELGCGTGDNLAYLVERGAGGVGIDLAAGQIRRARARWPKPAFHCVDAARYLSGCAGFDVCYSCFGAFSFYPAESLLDLVGAKLAPGGLLAVSGTVGDGTGPRRETLALDGGITVPVIRYEHTAREWRCLLAAAEFHKIDVTIVDEPRGPDTVIATARRLDP